MKHLLSADEAAYVRSLITPAQLDRPGDRIWAPPGERAVRADFTADGRTSCRECGVKMPGGTAVILFGFVAEPWGRAGWSRVAKAWIHFAACPANDNEGGA